jgi:plastocyanin
MRDRLGALVLLVAGSLVATTNSVHSKVIQVTINELKFSPGEVQAKVGDTIEWINKDVIAHTATARGRWDVMIPPNGTGRVVLKRAGQAAYYCRFHPNMTANITITERTRR